MFFVASKHDGLVEKQTKNEQLLTYRGSDKRSRAHKRNRISFDCNYSFCTSFDLCKLISFICLEETQSQLLDKIKRVH